MPGSIARDHFSKICFKSTHCSSFLQVLQNPGRVFVLLTESYSRSNQMDAVDCLNSGTSVVAETFPESAV
jgi:hypothetical protein